MRITARDLEATNERLRHARPIDILRLTREVFGERAAILCSMQRAGTALCHLADRAGLRFDVLFVDTGLLHAETRATRDVLAASHPNLRVVTLEPERSFTEQTAAEGLLYLGREGQARCCALRKIEPVLAVRARYDALVVALRRSEGGARDGLEALAIDEPMNALRIHPFAGLSPGGVDAYLAAHPDVALNPLHAMGFPTIGCFPCTTPALADEPERAGRWRHLAGAQYCGINPGDRARPAASVELDDRYVELLHGGDLRSVAARR